MVRGLQNPRFAALGCVLFMIALNVNMALAQGGAGELTGAVTDPSKAVVANASVTLTNSATEDKRKETTNTAGIYRFVGLPIVGTYTLEITAKGFRVYRVENIFVSVGTVTTYDAQLEVGAAKEVVTVEGGAQLVQTTDASLSQDVDRQVWEDLPLETRSQNNFVSLLAGAVDAATTELGADRGATVNGARSGTGNFLFDGFDNNDQGFGGAGVSVGPGGANTTISPDAIEEYRVIEHVPSAEYGKAGGFVTDTVLKSGTNKWHGSLFEYNRIQALAANSWFSDHSGVQDHLVRNQFGGSMGGPIIKDKTFFYFTAEAHRLRTSYPQVVNTITPDFVNFVQTGQFESFIETSPTGICNNPAFITALNADYGTAATAAPCPGAFAANATTGPLWQKIYAAEPLPFCRGGLANCTNLTNVAQGLWTGGVAGPGPITYPVNVYGTITVTAPSSTNQMRYSGKFDHKLSGQDQLSAAYLYDNADSFSSGGAAGPNFYSHFRAQNFGVEWSHTFAPTVLNQARAAYVRNTSNIPDDPKVLGLPEIFTYFDTPVFSFGDSDNYPQFFTENEFQYKDDIAVTRGSHNFKFGAEYRRTRNGSSFDAYKYGDAIPEDTEDLLTDATFTNIFEQLFFNQPIYGSLAYADASLNPQTGGLPDYYRGFRANEFAFYGQDDWKANSQLTFNLGLRWEYFGPPHNFQSGFDANFVPGSSTTPFTTASNNPFIPVSNRFYASIANGSVQLRNHDVWNKDFRNFGPRFGFAYDIRGHQKTVLRGGFGINYDRMYNNIFENIRFNPPLFAVGLLGTFGNGVVITPAQTSAIFTFPFTGTSTFAGAGLTPSIRDMDLNIRTAYYEQAHFGIQHEISKGLVLESDYVGTFGHKLIGIIGANTFDGRFASGYDNTAINPSYSDINLRDNCCDSNYHAWQTTLRKGFSGSLSMNINYTWSKAMDDVSDTFSTKNGSGSSYPTDSSNPHFDYGPADFDVRNRVIASMDYALPWKKRNRWAGGWSAATIVTVQSGANFSVSDSSVDSNKDNQFNDRAVYTGTGKITGAINHNISPANGYLTKSDFAVLNDTTIASVPTILCPKTVNMGLWCEGKALGQMERNTLIGPGYFNADFSVKKAFPVTENFRLRLEGNFFNIFNHPNFLAPDPNLEDLSTTFGESTGTFSSRVIQLALRFDF